MQLNNLLGSAYGRVREAVSEAKETAQERLVVLGGYRPSLSIKWACVGLLVAFLGGVWFATWWDYSGFRDFRDKAAALALKKEKENEKLSSELATLRAKMDADEAANHAADKTFVEVLNRPDDPGVCVVPVEGLNKLIVEASR